MLLTFYILGPSAVLGFLAARVLKFRQYRFRMRTALAALAGCIMGLWLTIDGAARLEAGFKSRNWPVVTGVVVASSVEGTRAFHPMVIYEYTVRGTLFRDSTALQQPSFGGRRRRKEVAETERSNYEPGQEVAVHYDPENPARSNLGRFLHWSDYGRTGTGGVLFGLGFCFICLYLFGRERPASEAG